MSVTSTVDWCEENYVHSRYIAEFWNSISSFTLMYAGIVGYIRHKGLDGNSIFIILALVGFGSILFHGVLSATTQMLDEIPMVFLLAQFTINILKLDRFRSTLIYLIACAFSYTIFKIAHIPHSHNGSHNHGVVNGKKAVEFYLFQGVVILSAGYIFMRMARMSINNTRKSTLTIYGAVLFGMGWSCWLIDYFFCNFLKSTWNPQLHAWWHILSALGVYRFCLLSLMFRNEGRVGISGRRMVYEKSLIFGRVVYEEADFFN